jgi:hypothetical protein
VADPQGARRVIQRATALDLDPERDHAPRDYAMHKAVAAFRAFEAGAKAVKTPLRITISLSPK